MNKQMKLTLCICVIAIFFMANGIYISYNWIKVNTYTYDTVKLGATESIQIIVLADLHDHIFGEQNEKLVEQVNVQAPDIILLNGDFLNRDSISSENVCHLVEQLIEIAPVYFVWGNHELEYMENHPELSAELTASGAVILDKTYVDCTLGGVEIRLGGMYDYAFGLNGRDEASAAPMEVRNFLEDFQDTNALKIMMCHRPDSFCFGDAAEVWDVDLVIAAHNHGGQVVLPLLGGMFGGDQGWFPDYIHGMYEMGDLEMFVTSGLGSNPKILPRFNNRPEVAVVNIVSK